MFNPRKISKILFISSILLGFSGVAHACTYTIAQPAGANTNIEISGWLNSCGGVNLKVYQEPSHTLYALSGGTDPYQYTDGAGSDYSVWWSVGGVLTEQTTYTVTSGGVLEWNPITDTSTRFISLTPLASSTVATTSNLGAHIYVNSKDYVSGMYLNVALTNQQVEELGGSALDAWNAATGNGGIEIPIATSGDMTLSTTTTYMGAGLTYATYSIRTPTLFSSLPIFGILFSPTTLVASSSYYFVGYQTAFNKALAEGGGSLVSYILTGTTTNPVPFCSPTTFSLEACLTSLIVPSGDQLNEFYLNVQQSILQKWPFGYITRAITILSTTTETKLPKLSATIPNGYPGAGNDITLDPFAAFASTSILNTATSSDSGETLKTIVEPYWKNAVLFAFGALVLSRLIKL